MYNTQEYSSERHGGDGRNRALAQGETLLLPPKKMLDVEKRIRRPLEKAIPEMLNEEGFTETAKQLKLSKATLNYWMLKLGIEVRRVALAPGEEIEIKRSTA